MSQITTNVTSTPAVATSYVTDAGTAVPIANVLNIATTSSGLNAANGITSSGAANNVTITLTNRISGAVTTVGAVTSNCLTFGLGAVPGVYAFEIFLNALDTTTPSGAVYRIKASIRTTGAAAVLVDSVDFREDEEAAMVPANWNFTNIGNAIQLDVVGVAGLNIRWGASGIFTFVS